jgi:hypothetical protein
MRWECGVSWRWRCVWWMKKGEGLGGVLDWHVDGREGVEFGLFLFSSVSIAVRGLLSVDEP